MTFAARHFWHRRDASNEACGKKDRRPEGCVAFGLWLRCSSVTAPWWGCSLLAPCHRPKATQRTLSYLCLRPLTMMRLIRSCYRGGLNYTRQVRISWKFLALAVFTAGSLLLAGCGGISASRTVSPLDFLLPGIIKASPPQTNAPVVVVQQPVEVATVR